MARRGGLRQAVRGQGAKSRHHRGGSLNQHGSGGGPMSLREALVRLRTNMLPPKGMVWPLGWLRFLVVASV